MERHARDPSMRLAGEDRTFWWADSPMQPTTMAIMALAVSAWYRAQRMPQVTELMALVPVNLRRPIGIDADETVMPDVEAFQRMIGDAVTALAAAAGVERSAEPA